MNLGAPLGLAAAALAVPLVVWYVLRSRRPSQLVASTFLWQRTERSVSAAVPWQRFRPDATFWLILLALLLGALALARPFVRVPAQLGDHTVLILDASASMLATEDGPTRLELARREAEDLIGRLSPGQEVSVIEAGSRARVLTSGASDPGAIRDAIRSVRPTHGAPDLVDAFTLAAALQRPGQSTVLHLLTDGVLPPEAVQAAPPGLLVNAVGEPRPNLAVTRVQAVPVGAGTNQVFVQVRNFGTVGSEARITLSVDGTDFVEEAVRLAPRGTEDRVFTVAGGDGEVLRARVEPVGSDAAGRDAADSLTVDDHAFAILSSPREVRVMLAGPSNVFLEAALSSVPGVTVETSPVVPANLLEIDLLVVDRTAAPDAPSIPTLLVAPTEWPAGIERTGLSDLPSVTFQAPGHELLAEVDLSEVALATAQQVTAPALTEVAGGPDGPLLLAGRIDGTPVVALPFDLLESNLPLQTAWPVFVANAVSWLAGPPVSLPATAGATLPIVVPAGVEVIEVSPPAGDVIRVDAVNPRVLLDQVGVWRFRYDGQPATAGTGAIDALAVNAVPDEGDLSRPVPDVAAPEVPGQPGTTSGTAAEGRRQLGTLVLIGVLALVLAEWLWREVVRPWRRGRARTSTPAPAGAGAP